MDGQWGKKKSLFRNDICRAISPLYRIGKASGLLPVRFSMHPTEGCRARFTTLDVAYSLAVLSVLLGAEIWGLWRDLKDGWEHSTRLKSRTAVVATCSDVLGVMGLTVVCIVGALFRCKYIQHAINKLIEVDEKMGGSGEESGKIRSFGIWLTSCSLAYLWLASILDFYSWSRKTRTSKPMSGKGPINYAPLYFMYTVIILTEIQYTVSTYIVGRRFVRLNGSLGKLVAGNVPVLVHRFREPSETDEGKTFAERIGELRTIHSSLCDAVTLINYTFGVVILAVTVTCLLHLVITPYFLIVQAGENHEWIFLVVQAGWCIFHIARMMMIVQPSYFAVAEGKRTAILVSRLLSACFEENGRRELEAFSLQLLHRPLEFSACGLFSLDRTLITSISGAVTTYLVILIQFQNADDTKCAEDIIKNATQILKKASPLQDSAGLNDVV